MASACINKQEISFEEPVGYSQWLFVRNTLRLYKRSLVNGIVRSYTPHQPWTRETRSKALGTRQRQVRTYVG